MCKSVSNVNFSVFVASMKKKDDPQKPSVYFSCSIAVIMLFLFVISDPNFRMFPSPWGV